MQIISDREETIFRNDYDGKPTYKIGLSKKDKDNKQVYGYIKANFKKGTELNNKTKIKIKSAWIDFYKTKEDITVPTIFVSEYEIVEQPEEKKETNPFEEFGEHFTTKFDTGQQIEISDNDLPF